MFENLKIAGRAIRTVFTADPITRVRRFYEISHPTWSSRPAVPTT
ncbi:hypothetical protein V2I01_30440 [Micromonospora sp. BRA006-A]|nr:hypothetical protein [Micromonospora sp. BRA006-A]